MMQNRLIKYLKQPYPRQIIKSWEMILIASFLVFFLLGTFQPFGISSIRNHKLLILLGYMFVTTVCLSVKFYIFPAIWRNYYKESNWTLGKEALSISQTVFLISLGNSLYALWLFSLKVSILFLLSCLTTTFLIAIFPITFFLIIRQNRLLANNLKAAMEMNNHLDLSRTVAHSNQLISLEGNSKDSVELDINELLFMEANGNYVNICYSENGQIKRKVLRSTIKQMEELLYEFPFILRCHRAFLVNINVIRQVEGNSQGYHLLLKNIEDEIPVSRAYSKEVKDRINTVSNK